MTQTCNTCNKSGFLYLIDGECPKCAQKPKETIKKKVGRPKGHRLSRGQMKESLRLQEIVRGHMKDLDMPVYKFAQFLGISKDAMYRWLQERTVNHYQKLINARIIDALGRKGLEC